MAKNTDSKNENVNKSNLFFQIKDDNSRIFKDLLTICAYIIPKHNKSF